MNRTPHPRSTARASFAVAAFALLLTGAVLAQSKPSSEDDESRSAADVFFERLDVNVVNVEVYVTDKKGNTVRGLTREDFEILEDGVPQEVTHFFTVENRLSDRPEAAEAAAPETAEPVPARRKHYEPPPEDEQLRLVIYFDNVFLRPANRNKVTRLTNQFVNRIMGPGDLVMLASFDKSLHIRHPFTKDLESFRQKLDEIELVTGFAQQAQTERRDVIKRIEASQSEFEAESHVDFYAKSLNFDVSQSIKALREVIGSLAGLPGRKALLYVSDGLPMTAGEELFHLLDLIYPNNQFGGLLQASRYNMRHRFRELTSNANANGVTIYTLEAAGLRSHASLSAEYGGFGDRSYVEIDSIREFSFEEPLMMMAADTGGLAALNTNNIDGALSRVVSDLENYYSLGYEPAHAVQGRYHKIDVRVKRKGVKVRHRTGYRDKVVSTRVHEGTLATLLFGPEKNPLEVKLNFAGAKQQEGGRRLVPLEVRIPLGRIALIPREELHQGQLRVAVAVLDGDGRVSPVDQKDFSVSIPAADLEAARQQYYVYAVELMMRPGDHLIAVGVHDDFSGEATFIRQPVRTPGQTGP